MQTQSLLYALMKALIEKFSRRYGLSERLCASLLERMKIRSYAKGERLICEGECNSHFYIVVKGVVRGYYCLNDGTDISAWFVAAGELMLSTWGYVRGLPSRLTVEALCDCEVYWIPKSELEAFFSLSVEHANFGRHLFEHEFLNLEDWMVSMGTPRAEERYLTLLQDCPELLQTVPLKHIATYLWMTPQSLSRIRAGLMHRPKRKDLNHLNIVDENE